MLFPKNFQDTDSLIRLYKKTNEDSTKIQLLIETGNILKENSPDSALYFYNKALEANKNLNNPKNLAIILKKLSETFILIGNYKSAINNFELLLDVNKRLNDVSISINCYNNLGYAYQVLGKYPLAIEYYLKSLHLCENLTKSTDNSMKKLAIEGIFSYYVNVGGIYLDQSDYIEAENHFNKAIELCDTMIKTSNDVELINLGNIGKSTCLNALGSIYYIMRDYTKAEEYFYKVLNYNKKINYLKGISESYNNLGNLFSDIGKYDKAIDYLHKSAEIRKKLNEKKNYAIIIGNIACCYNKAKEYSMALQYSDTCLEIAKDIGALKVISYAYVYKSDAYKGLKNFTKAYEFFVLYKQFSDSLINIESKKQIIEMQTKYETEKKEKKINNLQKQNQLKKIILNNQIKVRNILIIGSTVLFISLLILFIFFNQKRRLNFKLIAANRKLIESEKNLKKLNEIKNKFFSIISHDLRSPLSSIKTSFNILQNNVGTFTDEELKQFSHQILKSIDNISTLLDNLLIWSRTEIGQIEYKPTHFDLHEIVQSVISIYEIKAQQKQIRLISNINNEIEVFGDINMINFILRNLIDNAIKFTRKDGNIEIFSKPIDNNYVEIRIHDNGIGISEGNLKKIFSGLDFSTIGTQKETGLGLGLRLCNEFIKKHGGKIQIKSNKTSGTTCSFILPTL